MAAFRLHPTHAGEQIRRMRLAASGQNRPHHNKDDSSASPSPDQAKKAACHARAGKQRSPRAEAANLALYRVSRSASPW